MEFSSHVSAKKEYLIHFERDCVKCVHIHPLLYTCLMCVWKQWMNAPEIQK